MNVFRTFLLLIWLAIASYTAVVIANHGMGLLSVFFGDMTLMAWSGQFNLDFMCMLLLSGLWVTWRHRFSPPGLVLGLLAVLGGAWFLSTYLLVLSYQTRGDIHELLLGKARSALPADA